MAAWIITLVCLTLFALGLPIVLTMALWAAAISYLVVDLSLANFGQNAWYGLENFAFLALPLFIVTGDLVLAGGIARHLAGFANALVGWIRGGLAMATIMACGFFAAITAAAGGTVGVIIPPSIIYIVYGIIMNVSPVDLFVAGIVPGIFMVLFMMLAAHLLARFGLQHAPASGASFGVTEAVRGAWRARHGFVAVALIMGSIYLGIFSPTEAAALAAAYAWVAGVLFTRELKLSATHRVMHRSAQINGLLVPIVALSIMLQQAISLLGVTESVERFVSGFGGRVAVTAVIMLIILAVGTVFESVPNVIMTAPILAPAAYAVGIDPIQFAMIFLLGDTLGFITWPYGLNLFVASSLTGIPYMKISYRALWYCAALLFPWIMVAVFPWMTLGLLGR